MFKHSAYIDVNYAYRFIVASLSDKLLSIVTTPVRAQYVTAKLSSVNYRKEGQYIFINR